MIYLFYFSFSHNECPGLCWHRPGYSLGKFAWPFSSSVNILLRKSAEEVGTLTWILYWDFFHKFFKITSNGFQLNFGYSVVYFLLEAQPIDKFFKKFPKLAPFFDSFMIKKHWFSCVFNVLQLQGDWYGLSIFRQWKIIFWNATINV